jgi:NAD(P)-dependent dehydrogenase (short-subunit alcohol dehydrogenase family)
MANPSTIAITGTGSGFGWSLAESALSRAADLISIGRSHHPESQKKIDCDLREAAQGLRLGADEELPRIDLLVLNAYEFGFARRSMDITSQELLRHFEINVIGQREVLDHFLTVASLERVAIVSSGAAQRGYEGWLSYCVGKAAFDSLIRVYSKEFPETNFFSISPGVISTPMNFRLREAPDAREFGWFEKLQSPKETGKTADEFLSLCLDSQPESGSWTALA